MKKQFITEDKVLVHTTKFTDIFADSNGYGDFYEKLEQSNIEYMQEKTYEIASTGFVDFNHHLYEDINHMNSISAGIYIEMSLITFRIFIWGSKGEGFEIFKHVLLKEEIDSLSNNKDIQKYCFKYLNELEQGIVKTYNEELEKCFEKFGLAIESRQLPLNSLLQFISIQNNMSDFK